MTYFTVIYCNELKVQVQCNIKVQQDKIAGENCIAFALTL